jgi:hypothetical protein
MNELAFAIAIAAVGWFCRHKVPPFFTIMTLAVCGMCLLPHDTFVGTSTFLVEVCIAVLFLFVGHETTHAKPEKKIVMFAWYSGMPPAMVGAACYGLYVWATNKPIDAVEWWVVATAFSLSAMPVLSLWMDTFKAVDKDRAVALQSVAWIDLAAWFGLSLLLDSSRVGNLLMVVAAGLLVMWLVREKHWSWFLMVYFIGFLVCEMLHVHGLMWAMAAAWSAKAWRTRSTPPWGRAKPWLTYAVVPLVLIHGLRPLGSIPTIETSAVVWMGVFMGMPVVSRMAAVRFARIKTGLLASAKPWEVLLNARGLTELVFLSVAFKAGALSLALYVPLVWMAVTSTCLPIVMLKCEPKISM